MKPSEQALLASRVLVECLREAGDDIEAGFAAAEYILSTQDPLAASFSLDYPRNNSNQFLSKELIAEAARNDVKYKELRDSIPEEQRWKLDYAIGTLMSGGTIQHPGESPELGINLQGDAVNPSLAKYQSDVMDWEKRHADRSERRKFANKAVRSFRSERRPLDRVELLLKKAGATRAELRSLTRLRYDLERKKIPPGKFDRLCEELLECVHCRIDEEEGADPEPRYSQSSFLSVDVRGVSHREGGPGGGQFVQHGMEGSKGSSEKRGRRSTKLDPNGGTKPQQGQPQQQQVPQPKDLASIREHLASQAHLTPEQQQAYGDAAESVIGRMSQSAQARVFQNTKMFNWYGSTQELTDTMASTHKSFAAIQARGGTAGGGYDANSGLHLDGDEEKGSYRVSRDELYAHEMAHAIDGPRLEYSNSPEWTSAWAEEIGDQRPVEGQKAKLTNYATTSSREGFAEFGRLIYGANRSRAKIETMFPKCVAFWKKAGIWE